ncbi:DsrE family protein [Desulfoplanes formicivorans]|uniref:Uncharacterized protein n=1 Tax=Desulfoplanes formicivorans TaxID=1592317 RepID=A0A194ADW2_9BACT|nr:DsrE family protein [Desulfoplanes formicivorans]GAU07390.1 hypothetical protein DPF_0068 [Desulfoplanes formicivorans]
MTYKACFHVDLNDPNRLQLALNNVANFLNAKPEGKSVVVVNGPAVNLFRQGSADEVASRVRELGERGVGFQVCNNALHAFSIKEEELLPQCEVVAAGIVALIDLQNNGFAYIKP